MGFQKVFDRAQLPGSAYQWKCLQHLRDPCQRHPPQHPARKHIVWEKRLPRLLWLQYSSLVQIAQTVKVPTCKAELPNIPVSAIVSKGLGLRASGRKVRSILLASSYSLASSKGKQQRWWCSAHWCRDRLQLSLSAQAPGTSTFPSDITLNCSQRTIILMWSIETTESCNIMNLIVNQFKIYLWKVSMFLRNAF